MYNREEFVSGRNLPKWKMDFVSHSLPLVWNSDPICRRSSAVFHRMINTSAPAISPCDVEESMEHGKKNRASVEAAEENVSFSVDEIRVSTVIYFVYLY